MLSSAGGAAPQLHLSLGCDFSRFFEICFPLLGLGLMVFIGICSVLQLSSLICMVLVAFGVWIPQARDILNNYQG